MYKPIQNYQIAELIKERLKADFLSWQKLLATIFFQKKSVKW